MTAKEYLGQAYSIDRRVNIELEKIAAMKSALDYKPPSLQGSGGSGSGGLPEQIARVMDYEQRANRLIGELVSRKFEIAQTIDKVPDLRLREILVRRYLSFQKWEKIAVDMTIDIRWVFRLHQKALSEVAKILTIESH